MTEKTPTEQELLRRAEAAEERVASFEKQVLALALARDEDRMRTAEASERQAKYYEEEASDKARKFKREIEQLSAKLKASRSTIEVLQETIVKMVGNSKAEADDDEC